MLYGLVLRFYDLCVLYVSLICEGVGFGLRPGKSRNCLCLCSPCTEFQVAIASGFHLFPFRTEKLSPPAPMVLHTRGRVGSRRLFLREARRAKVLRASFVYMKKMCTFAFQFRLIDFQNGYSIKI